MFTLIDSQEMIDYDEQNIELNLSLIKRALFLILSPVQLSGNIVNKLSLSDLHRDFTVHSKVSEMVSFWVKLVRRHLLTSAERIFQHCLGLVLPPDNNINLTRMRHFHFRYAALSCHISFGTAS